MRTDQVCSSSHPRQMTITLPSTVPVHWPPGIQRALRRSTVVAVVAPRPCVALSSPWRRLCQTSCGHQGRGRMVYCMAGTRPLFCVPCVHHQLGPWSPACLEPGDDVPEKCVSVCQWNSSFPPAQTLAGVLEMMPSSLLGVPCCLRCGPPGYDPGPDREEAQGEEVGRLHQHLSGGVLCPGFGVCVWAWWPSGGPSCVCRLCCHLLRMDCWAGACGTSLYLSC